MAIKMSHNGPLILHDVMIHSSVYSVKLYFIMCNSQSEIK